MSTLLVDNYDSFSYNLVHYLEQITGSAPTVVRNDEPGWRLTDLDEFDQVVISPGPGTPGVAADFGICRDVVTHGRIPLLGVCLGMQGIAALGGRGGSVSLAPEPRHGRRSPVLHDGTGLFAGIPSPYEAVRYHSWAVDRLPDGVEATAWTPDGVLMALQHRERPQWGVQFHPESVGTEHGHQLLANFLELGADWNRRHRRRATPRPARPRPAHAAASRPPAPPTRVTYHVLVEELPTSVGAEEAYERLFLGSADAFWLDSSLEDPRLGRFSLLGSADGPLAQVVTADVATGTVTVRSDGRTRTEVRPVLDWLDDQLQTADVLGGSELPLDFHGGWVGYLGYELKAQCGGAAHHRSPYPDATLVFADRFLLVDHRTSTTYLVALHVGDPADARRWLAATRARLTVPADPSRRAPGPPPAAVGAVTLRHHPDAYLELVESCQRAIAAGESYEICLTNMIDVDGELDVWPAYTALRRDNPAPFAALLRFGDLAVLSTSPERFLRVDDRRRVEARPIKGTRPRGATPAEDLALREDLARSEKDRAENLMIVDLMRNDLAQVAAGGSVAVPELFVVETYASVHQLVSTVSARLDPARSAVDCVRAAFPGGSMTGAPKRRTMEIIDQLEAGPRGVYSGAIGYFSLSGSVDLNITIRTLVAHRGHVGYGVGGAVVALSDPVAELEETVVKARPLLSLLGASVPEHGVVAVGAPSGEA